MNTVDILFTIVWLAMVGTIAALGIVWPKELQAWHVARLEREPWAFKFVVDIAKSRYALWQIRVVGFIALLMFFCVLYLLLF